MLRMEEGQDWVTVRRALLDDLLGGQVVAVNASHEDYLEHFAQDYCEYIEGMVIRMPPAGLTHNDLVYLLRVWLDSYLEVVPLGRVLQQPFPMILEEVGRTREPDLMLLLNDHAARLSETALRGAADVVIEVASAATQKTDYGAKRSEYERGGVAEYWIINQMSRSSSFLRRSAQGRLVEVALDAEGVYRTPLLPRFVLQTDWLYRLPLPDVKAIRARVAQLMGE